MFRWPDLELLDDPIPERLYCQKFRRQNRSPSTTGLEEGEGLEEVAEDTDLDEKPTEGVYPCMCTCTMYIHVVRYNDSM